MEQIRWIYFPNNSRITKKLKNIIKVFEKNYKLINSEKYKHRSNVVLNIVSSDLQDLGYKVEINKKNKIKVPVLYDENGNVTKSFELDAYNNTDKTIIEVEAGRAFDNNQVIKDFFESYVIEEVKYLVIAVRNNYRGRDDFSKIEKWFEAFYLNSKIEIPIKGLLLIGY